MSFVLLMLVPELREGVVAMAKIMIAEDSATERKMLADALGELGHELVEVDNGEDAERLFFEAHPDLLILDVIMPKKDGFQVCRAIKSDGRYADTPIIMISARNRKSDQYWGLRQGANEYLPKPFKVAHLLNTVQGYL